MLTSRQTIRTLVAAPSRTGVAQFHSLTRLTRHGESRCLRIAPLQVAELSTSRSAAISESIDSSGAVSSGDAPVAEGKVPWYKKPCAFRELASVEEMMAVSAQGANEGKMTVVDFYAGWCASCKSSFPTLCRIPNNELMASKFNFYKANIEESDFASFIKKRGVRGIPHLVVFDVDGSHLIGMSASFKKMEVLRKNLEFIAKAEKHDFVLDPNGLVIAR